MDLVAQTHFFSTFQEDFFPEKKGAQESKFQCFYSNIIPNILSAHSPKGLLFLKGKYQLRHTVSVKGPLKSHGSLGRTTLKAEITIYPFLENLQGAFEIVNNNKRDEGSQVARQVSADVCSENRGLRPFQNTCFCSFFGGGWGTWVSFTHRTQTLGGGGEFWSSQL